MERQERTGCERVRIRFLEGGRTLPSPGQGPSVIRLAPLTPSNPLMDHQAVPQTALYQLPPHL